MNCHHFDDTGKSGNDNNMVISRAWRYIGGVQISALLRFISSGVYVGCEVIQVNTAGAASQSTGVTRSVTRPLRPARNKRPALAGLIFRVVKKNRLNGRFSWVPEAHGELWRFGFGARGRLGHLPYCSVNDGFYRRGTVLSTHYLAGA